MGLGKKVRSMGLYIYIYITPMAVPPHKRAGGMALEKTHAIKNGEKGRAA